MRESSIKEYAAYLKLSYIKNNYDHLIKLAKAEDMDHETFLDNILESEVLYRKENLIRKRQIKANFPYKLTLNEFKREHLSTEIQRKIKELETLEFVTNKENIILIGNPGTGKTALSLALGLEACLKNKTVLFISVPQLLIEINEAMSRSELLRYKRKFERYDLVIIDELGYSSFSKDSGEILFNLLSSRNNSGSLIITSNLTLDRWNEVFHDTILTGAIVDRLANRAHMIDMSGESYRIRQTKEWMNSNATKD